MQSCKRCSSMDAVFVKASGFEICRKLNSKKILCWVSLYRSFFCFCETRLYILLRIPGWPEARFIRAWNYDIKVFSHPRIAQPFMVGTCNLLRANTIFVTDLLKIPPEKHLDYHELTMFSTESSVILRRQLEIFVFNDYPALSLRINAVCSPFKFTWPRRTSS